MDDDEMMVKEFNRRLNELNAMFNELEKSDIAVTIKMDVNTVRGLNIPFLTAISIVKVLNRPGIFVP